MDRGAMDTAEAIVVQTTVGSPELAQDMARQLVELRVAACVQVFPVSSTYRWEGQVETGCEVLVAAKTTRGGYDALEAAIRKLHVYKEPEIVALPIVRGSLGYLAWLRDNVEH
jgi:periplasmic divalent cation tolerance protein